MSKLQVIVGSTRPTRAAEHLAQVALGIVLDDLEWWSRAFERARSEGELLPGSFRARAAAAAAAEH